VYLKPFADLLREGRVRCLSVRQPWAGCLVTGAKTVENRKWPEGEEARAKLPGWYLIHASKIGEEAGAVSYRGRHVYVPNVPIARVREVRKAIGGFANSSLDLGAIVGAVHVPRVDLFYTDRDACNPWACGPVLWRVDVAIVFEGSIPCSGSLGLWKPSEAVLGRVLRELPRAVVTRYNGEELPEPRRATWE